MLQGVLARAAQAIALAEHDLGHGEESDRAFEWLDHAYRERDPAISFVRLDPALRGLRDDPRYVALLAKLNFPAD
jgi:hypothetical protein